MSGIAIFYSAQPAAQPISGGAECCSKTGPGSLQCEKPIFMATPLIASPVIDPRYTPFRLLIRKSKIHHRGVYADEPIPPGRKVIEYTGERISRRETKRRGDTSVTYLFTLDNYWTLDGAV